MEVVDRLEPRCEVCFETVEGFLARDVVMVVAVLVVPVLRLVLVVLSCAWGMLVNFSF